eukprot:TRINITY_DN1762_c1_g3_i1.p1 TRINITY_DN1762_c1_g3~~TRINITY_DN1762_c1_g3_i1.p1  ORF type:complete len:629 (+),score=200.28 TRINITY_DN1762_c1_g3_i1:172-2058(+)
MVAFTCLDSLAVHDNRRDDAADAPPPLLTSVEDADFKQLTDSKELSVLCAEINAIAHHGAIRQEPVYSRTDAIAASATRAAESCFRAYPGAGECGRSVLVCSLQYAARKDIAETQCVSQTWRDTAPRCYGDVRRRALLQSFSEQWDAAVAGSADGGVVAVLNIRNALRPPPIAVLQQVSLMVASRVSHSRGSLARVVVYPATAAVEHVVRGSLRFVDPGRVTEHANVVFPTTADELVQAVGMDSPGTWARADDVPVEVHGASPQRERREARDQSLVTPWYPYGVSVGEVSFDEELAHFAAFVIAEPAERSRRLALRGLVHHAVANTAVGATVKVVGPEAHGLVAPGEPLLLSADGVCDKGTAVAAVSAAGLRVVPWAAGPCGGVAALAPCGTRVELLWGPVIAADARRGISEVRRWVQEFSPGAATAYLVLRQVLSQSSSTAGCIGADTLLMMVLHTCRRLTAGRVPNTTQRGRRGAKTSPVRKMPRHNQTDTCCTLNAERVLRAFLATFAGDDSFDFANYSVDPRCADPVEKRHPEDPLSVLGPSGALNLAIGCSNAQLTLIRAQLQYCMHALQRADSKTASAAGQTSGPRRGGRRTPLSMLVCHDHLWKLRDKEQAPLRWPVVSIN